ncbi:MAG: hypothetical protein Q8Q59_07085 [Luteolibacter sp.]|jgi:hypothetical protein|nr:hypothetical protein [Luteolibacter sp.]
MNAELRFGRGIASSNFPGPENDVAVLDRAAHGSNRRHAQSGSQQVENAFDSWFCIYGGGRIVPSSIFWEVRWRIITDQIG